jgi:small redox-active disulfide protein 2
MIVKVLGASCPKCKALETKLHEISKNHNLKFEIEKVTQLNDIMNYGVMMTPGLVIDEQVKCAGKIPNDEQLLQWLKEI